MRCGLGSGRPRFGPSDRCNSAPNSFELFQHLAASVNSAATSCPLGNSPIAPFFNSGDASASNLASGAKARAVTTSIGSGARLAKSAIRSAWTIAGAPVSRTASRRKAAFLPMLSTRWTCAPGVSASAQAIAKPGNPPPEPRSTQIFAPGAKSRSCKESAIWRVQTVNSVDAAIRFIRCCHCNRSATKRSRRAAVSRETGVSPRPRARSAVRSGAATCGFGCGLAVLPAHMSGQQRQGHGRDPFNSAGVTDRPRPLRLQLVPDLIGKTG